LVVLATPDELSLTWLCDDAAAAGLRVVRFHEPDLGGALTAAAFEPAAHRLFSHLPVALAAAARAPAADARARRDAVRQGDSQRGEVRT
jgi:hypothetical protein